MSPNVVPAWRQRYEQVSNEIKCTVEQYKAALNYIASGSEVESAASTISAINDGEKIIPDDGADARQLLCKALTSSVPGAVVGVIDLENKEISYNIERVSRLKLPYAAALLRAYAAYLATDGFDHDLTRTRQSQRAS